MNLTEWAQGIHVTTACRWYREGKVPVPARKAGRLILVSPEAAAAMPRKDGAGLYARMSWHDQEAGLDRQVARLPPGLRKPACPWSGSGPRSARA